MSDRNRRYGDSSHGDPFQAPTTGLRGDPTTGGDRTDEMKDKGQQAMDQASQKGQQAKEQASQKGEQAKQKAQQATGMAQERADQGMDQAAQGMDQAAEKLRQQGGTAGSMATTAADKLDSASSYLRDKDTNQIVDDVEELIRRKPTESLLAAAGIGFVLSKVFR